MKIQEQPSLNAGKLHVREQLRLMNWLKLLGALDFNDDGLLDDQIHPIGTF